MPQEIALVLIFLVSSFTMSFAGFGFALVSVPLLALVLPIKYAVGLQFPYVMGLFIYQAWRYRTYLEFRLIRPLFWGNILGLTLGTLLLYQLPEIILKRTLAVFIVAVELIGLVPAGKSFLSRHIENPWWGRICGFTSGSFFGAYTIGGPPAVIYIRSATQDPLRAKSALASFFSLQLLILGVIYLNIGMLTWEGLKASLIFSPVVVVGSICGFWAFGRASNRLYAHVISAILLFAAAVLWLRA